LALWQAGHVAALLSAAHSGLEVSLLTVATTGDHRPEVPVWEMGGRGVFVHEVQAAVLAGRADAAVHSAKDLPPTCAPGLCLAAVPQREDPRDALVGNSLAGLATGAVVATGSQRRRAQLAHLRPDLVFESLRGNIAARLSKVPSGGAIVVAVAALARLSLLGSTALEVLGTDLMLPQVGQGALALECRDGDTAVAELLRAAEDPAARRQVDAERAFLASVGGACDLPVAAYAAYAPSSFLNGGAGPTAEMHLEGLLASPDGKALVRRGTSGPASEPEALGREVAELVLSNGGRELLAAAGGGP
jgi:hydroxymethylbilane synthase